MSEFNGVNKKIIAGLVGLAIIILIIVLVAAFKSAPTSDLSPEDGLAAQIPDDVVGYRWPTYTAPQKDYALLYPDSWLVEASDPKDPNFLNLTNGKDFVVDLDRYPVKVVMDISVAQTGSGSLESFLKTRVPVSDKNIVKTLAGTTASGLEVVKVVNEAAKVPYALYAIQIAPGKAVFVEAHGYLKNQTIDDIIKSVAVPQ